MQKKILPISIIVFVFFFSNCTMTKESNKVIEQTIHSDWQFSKQGENKFLPAHVPGNIHSDLILNEKIPDPYFGVNEKDLQWIGETNWEYKTSFQVNTDIIKQKNIELQFEGLDTYADVFLNGNKILSSDNMFRTWRVDAKEFLREGENKMRIVFRNVFEENLPKYNSAPFRLQAFGNNDQADIKLNLYSRKAGFHYGWDWGPRFVTCGIWRPVKIIAWNTAKIENIQIKQKSVSKKEANLSAIFEIENSSSELLNFSLSAEGKELANLQKKVELGNQKVQLDFTIKNPKLWWSNGLGEAHLYNLQLKIEQNEELIDSVSLDYGVRTIEVIRDKDSLGTAMYVKLNGVPVFMKGANYIPQDNFQSRVTPEKYERLIQSAVDANMNMLRVWGGGIYEEDIFYDLCDQNGILVWQDLMFACGMYPGDSLFLQNVSAEVVDNVKRLRNHASLALWCGNNENEVGWNNWGWKELYDKATQQEYEQDLINLFHKTIPKAIAENDDRYYHPTSPNTDYKGIGMEHGDVHYWGVWHGKEPFKMFNEKIGRFMSEYGFQSYPEWNTILKFTEEKDRKLHSEVILSHQRCMADERKDKEYGNRLIQQYLDRNYKQPKDFKSYVYITHVLQAEGVKIAMESHRRNMPFCMGTLYWQINDCWPVASWSSIDYYGNWKALHYYAKRAYAEILPIIYENKDKTEIWIVSDRLTSAKAKMEVKLLDFNGNVLFEKSEDIEISSNTSKLHFSELTNKLVKNKSNTVLIVSLKEGDKLIAKNSHHFVPVKELELPKPQIDVNVAEKGNEFEITLKTDVFAKHVYLWVEAIDLKFSDNYFDLQAGEEKMISCKKDSNISLKEFKQKLLIQNITDTF